jgi:hypothetical protein
VTAIAKGPFMVKLEWVASGKERHPPVTYLEQLDSRATAIEKGMGILSRVQSLDLACVAAWWREVGPGESRESGRDGWHLVGRNTVPGGAGVPCGAPAG